MMLVMVCFRSESFCAFVMSDAACRLYFDLEFDQQSNPGHDGERMVDIFLQVTCACFTLMTYPSVLQRFSCCHC